MKLLRMCLLFIGVWLFSALVHDFDISRECSGKGSMHLLIYKTSITCTVNVER